MQADDNGTILATQRLVLRPWREADRSDLAAMNADPHVMRHFPEPLSPSQNDTFFARLMEKQAAGDITFQPVEEKATGRFLGFVGLNRPGYVVPGAEGTMEIGWRLVRDAWGRGIATEAAQAWLRFGFETLGLDEIVAFTAEGNLPSQAVMRRIAMTRDEHGDFAHPLLSPDHRLSRHVLYRLARPAT
ncbi:GNAT family N-acetyltransferase [Stappia sp. ICDLI1TA098]|jgi:RimJ/RimL family protein N-acetyltransferase